MFDYFTDYYRAYVPVTAFTLDIPIIVNGININSSLYPALNYRPVGSSYPYIYIPAFEFARAGASVSWDNAGQRLIINSSNDGTQASGMLRDIQFLLADSTSQQIMESNYANTPSKPMLKVTNITENEIEFEGVPSAFSGNYTGQYTDGQSYPYYSESAMGGQRGVTVKDNFGVWHIFGYKVPLES